MTSAIDGARATTLSPMQPAGQDDTLELERTAPGGAAWAAVGGQRGLASLESLERGLAAVEG